MNWLDSLFRRDRPVLSAGQAERLAAWRALPKVDPRIPFSEARYVVVDVESSGLNIDKDRLIAIGAIAVSQGRIDFNDAMEVVLQQEKVSAKSNILIHGITGEVQREGVPPAEALLGFLDYLGKAPLLAFHVAFDNIMITKAIRKYLGFRFEHSWADLAYVAPALFPEHTYKCRSLDQWMAQFHIDNFARHSALADAVSTAELLMHLRARMRERKIDNFRDLRDTDRTYHRAISSLGGP